MCLASLGDPGPCPELVWTAVASGNDSPLDQASETAYKRKYFMTCGKWGEHK